ncbi:MAG: arsenate reductase (glutaredoxin) [Planctomycetota bacterium]|nr:MAG: arsenate reductase (glutaredoxin) [Planctomycetota bacterium]
MTVTVWFNPACSKCRGVKALLEQRGIEARYRLYLEQPPSVEEIEDLLSKLGDPEAKQLLRSKDVGYIDQGLADATPTQRIAASCATPSLINRPIVVSGERAIVARPPELALEVL